MKAYHQEVKEALIDRGLTQCHAESLIETDHVLISEAELHGDVTADEIAKFILDCEEDV